MRPTISRVEKSGEGCARVLAPESTSAIKIDALTKWIIKCLVFPGKGMRYGLLCPISEPTLPERSDHEVPFREPSTNKYWRARISIFRSSAFGFRPSPVTFHSHAPLSPVETR